MGEDSNTIFFFFSVVFVSFHLVLSQSTFYALQLPLFTTAVKASLILQVVEMTNKELFGYLVQYLYQSYLETL